MFSNFCTIRETFSNFDQKIFRRVFKKLNYMSNRRFSAKSSKIVQFFGILRKKRLVGSIKTAFFKSRAIFQTKRANYKKNYLLCLFSENFLSGSSKLHSTCHGNSLRENFLGQKFSVDAASSAKSPEKKSTFLSSVKYYRRHIITIAIVEKRSCRQIEVTSFE